MLAEELVRHARAELLNSSAVPFSTACGAASALSRMAALHQVTEYRSAAVIAPDADYARDAVRLLERAAHNQQTFGLAAAGYALAAGELQSAF